MGLVRRPRKKYETPRHPWEATRIQEENKLKKDYGLKNKKEIWKMASLLKKCKDQVKQLTARTDEQADVERKALMGRLGRLGLLTADGDMMSILDFSITDMLNRRLQSVLISKGIARSMRQSRQMITHGHIMVAGKKMNVPSYVVPVAEEGTIDFVTNSPFNATDHPERTVEKKVQRAKPATPIKATPKVDKTKVETPKTTVEPVKETPKEEAVAPAA